MNYLNYSIERETEWGMSCNEITIGSKSVSVTDLGYYYIGIHQDFSYLLRAAKNLCFTGLEVVVREPAYRCQADVDKVFFQAVEQACESFLAEWVGNWKEVYRQFACSRMPFWGIILTGGQLAMPGKLYKRLQEEVSNIKRFFSILNMPEAARMIVFFAERFFQYYESALRSAPNVYPFALAGKPASVLPGANEQLGLVTVNF